METSKEILEEICETQELPETSWMVGQIIAYGNARVKEASPEYRFD